LTSGGPNVSRRARRLALVSLGLLLVVLGSSLAWSGGKKYLDHQSLVHNEVRATGQVLSVAKRTGDPCDGADELVKFSDARGADHTVAVTQFCHPIPSVGQQATLLYDRTRPDNAELPGYWFDSDASIDVGISVSIGTLLVASGLAIYVFLLVRRSSRKHASEPSGPRS
jgi:hypothetical protein